LNKTHRRWIGIKYRDHGGFDPRKRYRRVDRWTVDGVEVIIWEEVEEPKKKDKK